MCLHMLILALGGCKVDHRAGLQMLVRPKIFDTSYCIPVLVNANDWGGSLNFFD